MIAKSSPLVILCILVLSSFMPVTVMAAADVVTVGSVNATGTTVDVPVFIRDVAGTSLGVDQPAGSRIQSYSIKVTYAPASSVSSVTFTRAGITANLTPTSEFSPASAGAISLLDTFQESTNPIPFTLNAATPGDRIAHLVFTLSGSANPGTSITLTLDPSLTQLTDAGGSASTKETSGNGGLTLVNGAITIPPLTIALTPSALNVRVNNSGSLTATLSGTTSVATTVTLASSNTAVATVPASVSIAAGSRTASVSITPKTIGTTDITASIAGSTSTSTVTIQPAIAPNPCPPPAAPQVSAPSSAVGGAAYVVSWLPVTDATEYVVSESTDENFPAGATTTQTITITSASFTRAGDARYFYRVVARNHTATCDVSSQPSNTASVLVTNVPLPPMSLLPVVGSTPGAFGSYFKTSMQLYNPKSATLSGKLVFHSQRVSGAANDPSLTFAIAPGKTVTYADLLPAMGVASGLGSVDVIGDLDSGLPVSLVRVFNDGGAAGTTGFAEEQMMAAEALQPGSVGVLLAPSDVEKFRLAIGIRTLDRGVMMTITVRNADGIEVKSVTRGYDPTYFAQLGVPELLDGYTLAGGESITFAVISGSAFVYGATTDNITNDPSVQFARRFQ
ncbi:MAG: hypothetical protein QOI24_2706 [Acidobacteriota bacterium]|jgi:hypothetical protein|nr:hypothetical protein [Acidobacteriota bacterium]